ncbi:MAG: hypothetical protein RIG84_03935 [Roseovarius sp.]
MHFDKLNFTHLCYDPEAGAFSAIAEIEEAGIGYAYPVHLKTVPSADFAFIAQGLAREAASRHRHAPARRMRLRRVMVPAHESARPVPPRAGTLQPRPTGAAPAA